MHSNLIEGCPYLKTGVHDLKRDYFQKSVYMCGVQRYNLKQTLIGCPCCPYCKTSVHDSKRDYFQKRDISGGGNPTYSAYLKIYKGKSKQNPKKAQIKLSYPTHTSHARAMCGGKLEYAAYQKFYQGPPTISHDTVP